MAKRVRGSTSRPGQRAPLQRTATRRPTSAATTATPVRSDELTDAEEARAAELEAAIVAEERRQEATKAQAKTTRTTEQPPARTSTLAASAADEYAYVARDVRRITIVGGSMLGILVGLWVIATVTNFHLF